MIVVYIAGPYTGTPWDTHEHILNAQKRGRQVAELGAMPLIPHSNTPACFLGTQDADFWYRGTLELLKRCDALITVPGWRDWGSTGTNKEIGYCMANQVPVFHNLMELAGWLKHGQDPKDTP